VGIHIRRFWRITLRSRGDVSHLSPAGGGMTSEIFFQNWISCTTSVSASKAGDDWATGRALSVFLAVDVPRHCPSSLGGRGQGADGRGNLYRGRRPEL